MTFLTPEERITHRKVIARLSDLHTKLEVSLKRGTSLSLIDRAHLERHTRTDNPQAQMRALPGIQGEFEGRYRRRLQAEAHDYLPSFIEWMVPDLPPVDHHYWICDRFMEIERRDMLRATFSMPPGHRKTEILSRYGPAWYLGRNPNHRWLQGAHSQDFVEKEMGQYVRDIIDDQAYRDIFPEIELNSRSTSMGSWKLAGYRGAWTGKGVGQSISGYRGNIGGIDDPIGKRADAQSPTMRSTAKKWLMVDFRPRLLPGSPLYIVATRWHQDDMIGYCEQLNKEGKGIPWTIYNLSAIIETEEEAEIDILERDIGGVLWPTLYAYDVIMDIKATTPSEDWWALYKGSPRDSDGNVVKKAWTAETRYDVLPTDAMEKREVKRITVSVDCAEKATLRSKFTAVGVWIETVTGRHYLAHVERKRVEYTDMIVLIEDTARNWGATAILVEDAGNGTPYINQRQGLAPAPIVRIPKPSKDSKQFRFDETTPMWESGLVWLPRTATWLPDYESEILAFPNAMFTDQVDMTSQYLAWARKVVRLGTKKLRGGGHKR